MSKSSKVVVAALVVLVAVVHPVHAADDGNDNVLTEDGLLMGILDFIASPITNTVADAVEGSCKVVNNVLFDRGNSSAFDCDCDGEFTVSDGLDLNVDCGWLEEGDGLCLFGFCGLPALKATISPTGFEEIKVCVEFENDPAIPIPAFDPFCFTGYGVGWFAKTPFAYDSCEVDFNNEPCTCTVCENKRSFKYDCSMNTVQTNNVALPFLPDATEGPKMDLCLGVGTFEEIWEMVFPPPPTPPPTAKPTISPMPSSMPSIAPSSSPSAAPSEMPSLSPLTEEEQEEDEDGGFWGFLPW